MTLQYTILQIAGHIGLQLRPGTVGRVEVEARCPFCNDTSYHLSLNTIKNVFRCNRCKETGGMLRFYASVSGVTTKEAYAALQEKPPSTFQYPLKNQASVRIYPTKPPEERHRVYNRMLELLSISDIHLYNLKKRGLSIKVIQENGYKSIPLLPEVRQVMVKKLSSEFDL